MSTGSAEGLRTRLLSIAVGIVGGGGPDVLSLREVQRRAGVSPAAAYRHFRDRDALLLAVGRHASAVLADAVAEALVGLPAETEADCLTRLRAGCAAYLDLAAREPGLYRAIFRTGETPAELDTPAPESVGSGGRGPYELLRDCLVELAAARGVAVPPHSATTVWAACHGLAMLLQDSPLRRLPPSERQAARDRVLDVVVAGLFVA